jgi:hypothetical protein
LSRWNTRDESLPKLKEAILQPGGRLGKVSSTRECAAQEQPQPTSFPPGRQSRRTSDASNTLMTGGANTAPMIMQPLLTSDHSLPYLDRTASRACSSDANTSTPFVHVWTMCPDDGSNAMICTAQG